MTTDILDRAQARGAIEAEPAPLRKPPWIRVRVGGGERCARMRRLVEAGGLHTVCTEALCPNLGACWDHGRATLMILGETCSRSCAFCGVRSQRTGVVDDGEPARVADAVRQMGLRDVVITSVTRDDLPDGGARIWAGTIRGIRARAPGVLVEVLVPDFGGDAGATDAVLAARPDVWGHNLETVPSLYARVRSAADYDRSLQVLRRGAEAGLVTKTGVMLGLGETDPEVTRTMADARAAGVRIFYIGQYLRPTRRHAPVARYVHPDAFAALRAEGLAMGFDVVVSGPLVRSSFHAEEQAAFLERTCRGRG